MDPRLGELKTRRSTVSVFSELASVMRGAAASRMQRAQALIAGVDAYAATLAEAMAQARQLMSAEAPIGLKFSKAPPLLIVLGGEQGFSGGFDTQVVDACGAWPQSRVLMVGTHAVRIAQSRGIRPEWWTQALAHADGATDAGGALHEALGRAVDRYGPSEVMIVAPEIESTPDGLRVLVHTRRLLPLEWPEPAALRGGEPMLHLPAKQVLDELGLEFVAAQLTRALLHAHAAESFARQQAMAAATENAQRMLQALGAEESRLRQEEITAEIVELAGRTPN